MSTNLEAEERALGKWPRRLLYVPELISYAWQPGNTYNGIKEPVYNIISYTWGRWRLKDSEKPEVEALDICIDGDEWPIPRINPEHFTAEQLEGAIESAAAWTCEEDEEDVDFVWLDIACIAQCEDARSAAEIGRQALVFQGAKYVFGWLTTLSDVDLKETIDDMWWFENIDPSDYSPRHSRANQNLTRLLKDPWFSSLWTLQEAFLRQDAYLLSSNPTLVPRGEFGSVCDMSDILYPCSHWIDSYRRVVSGVTKAINAEYLEVARTIDEKGLRALSSQHEVSMYVAAQSRKTTYEEDRIYGLQQIFGLRLGKTQSTRAGKNVTLAGLQKEFGEALLLQYPVHSQMHVFSQHVPAHDRWRIHPCSHALGQEAFQMPHILDESVEQSFAFTPNGSIKGDQKEAGMFRDGDASDSKLKDDGFISVEEAVSSEGSRTLTVLCSISMDHTAHSSISVIWQGRVCSFHYLWRLSDRIYNHVHLKRRREAEAEGLADDHDIKPEFLLFAEPDKVDELPGAPVKCSTSYEVVTWLARTFSDIELHVLLLGYCWPSVTRTGFTHGMFALLLLPGQEQWVRIGVCQWHGKIDASEEEYICLTDAEKQLLIGEGETWVEKSGRIGFVD